jgi:hypothetical protein
MATSGISNYPENFLIKSTDIQKLSTIISPQGTATEEVRKIGEKLFEKANQTNATYGSIFQTNERLKEINLKLRSESGEQKRISPSTEQDISFPLTDDEEEEIGLGVNSDAVRNFAEKVFNALKKVAELQEENRTLEKENRELQEKLSQKLLFAPVQKEPQSPSISSTPSPASSSSSPIGPSPLEVPKKKLHPSREQEEAEKRRLIEKPIPLPSYEKRTQWIEDLRAALYAHRNDIKTVLSPPKTGKKQPSDNDYFAKFLNQLNKHPETIFSSFVFGDAELDAIEYAIEYLGGPDKTITEKVLDKLLKGEVDPDIKPTSSPQI